MLKLSIPPEIHRALSQGATLFASNSGGKDSHAITLALAEAKNRFNWGQYHIIHADLGRAEWPQSAPLARQLAAQVNAPYHQVNRAQGDLIAQITARLKKLAGTNKPYWPSASNRYCTSDHKRSQIDKHFTTINPQTIIISAIGFRAEESDRRAKKPLCEIHKSKTSKYLRKLTVAEAINQKQPDQRLTIDWYPILPWTEDDVYQRCGHSLTDINTRRQQYRAGQKEKALSGWKMHPAYVFGNQRVSCIFCVLASQNDLGVGAQHHPALLEIYRQIEIAGNSTFKNGWSLSQLQQPPVQTNFL